jgi:hypothetical protein
MQYHILYTDFIYFKLKRFIKENLRNLINFIIYLIRPKGRMAVTKAEVRVRIPLEKKHFSLFSAVSE